MGLNFGGFFLLGFNKTYMWSFGLNWFVFRGKKATVSKMYCNMLRSCFISVPVRMHAFSLSLTLPFSLPRQIPAVIPSTQCNKLPIRLCCTFQRQMCATAPPLLHQLLGTVSLPRLQEAVRNWALPQNAMATHRATARVTRGPNGLNYWNKIGLCWSLNSTAGLQRALLLFNLFFPPATHQCMFFFSPFH